MFNFLATFTIRRRRLILAFAGIAFVVTGVVGGGVADRLSSGGFDDPDAESSRGNEVLKETFGTGTPNVVLLVTAAGGDIDDPAVAEFASDLAAQLAAETFDGLEMTSVVSYWDLPAGNPLASADGDKALILGNFDDDDSILLEASDGFTDRYTIVDDAMPATVDVGGFGPLFAEINHTIEKDLVRAELIAVPITLLLLLFIFRGVVAAVLPLLIGALSVVGTFFVLFIINELTKVSVFALNLTTAMGLGLAIDYSLFIVSRFREELDAHPPDEAVRRTVLTAGRTVAFSALTVGVALSALLVFNIAFLRSFAYAGLAVSVLAGIYAVVVLPAMLGALGTKVNAIPLGRGKQQHGENANGRWYQVAKAVMRRPIPVTLGVLVLLVALGWPSASLELGLPDDRVLPPSAEVRTVTDSTRADFDSKEAGAASVVIPSAAAPEAHAGDVDRYATALALQDNVARVDAETGIYCGSAGAIGVVECEPGARLLDADAGGELTGRFVRDNATYLSVVPTIEPVSAEGKQFIADIRSVDSAFGETLVTGPSAQLVDSTESILGDLPLALAIIALTTFVLLFMMFGSLLVPLKALVLNLFSLSATFGAMVWVFQEGNGSGLLNFTATGTLAATIPVLMFCVAFGLSMDYEVFLLSRIKEEHDRGETNTEAVARGLGLTGRIVTSAALLISVVLISFATSSVSFIKLFGIGLTLAVLLDAFVIRGTLVPAFMRLAGEANWWAPGPLRRFHDRFGLSEHVDLDRVPTDDATSD